ncbi:MAG: DUF2059 domain-containing protein [Magnetococcales bacterium]|nr:DUF2059 domain-containing protein [Magnetococcales bacterium]
MKRPIKSVTAVCLMVAVVVMVSGMGLASAAEESRTAASNVNGAQTEKVKKIKRLLTIVKSTDALRSTMHAMATRQTSSLQTQLLKNHPEYQDVVPRMMARYRHHLVEEVMRLTDDMMEQVAEYYDTTFSEEEVDQVLAFLESSAGRKYIKSGYDMMPKVTRNHMKNSTKAAITAYAHTMKEFPQLHGTPLDFLKRRDEPAPKSSDGAAQR